MLASLAMKYYQYKTKQPMKISYFNILSDFILTVPVTLNPLTFPCFEIPQISSMFLCVLIGARLMAQLAMYGIISHAWSYVRVELSTFFNLP